jgi:tellurite resistance protein
MVATLVDPQQLELGLRAVKMVAMADGEFDLRERKLLAAADRALRQPGSPPADLDALVAIEPAELAAAISDPLLRTRIVQAQIIMAMMDGDIEASEYAVVVRFAEALGVDEPRLENLRQYMGHHYTLLKLDLNRRSEMIGTAVRHAYRTAGLRGAWKNTAPFLSKRFALDDELAWKYRRLGLLPEDTFGRQYWIHMRERGFAFPGEPGAFPEEFIKHDCCHVLGGYDTDPAGECEVVAFVSGFMGTDPFWYLFMVTMHMHLGIETFNDNPLGELAFDPDRVVAALARGQRAKQDLYDPEFDWWALFPKPLARVREELGVA